MITFNTKQHPNPNPNPIFSTTNLFYIKEQKLFLARGKKILKKIHGCDDIKN